MQVLGVSFDTVVENAAFAKRFEFNFPCLCDSTRAMGLAYGACDDPKAEFAKRITYVIGPDGRVTKAYPKVSAAAHPEEVLKDL